MENRLSKLPEKRSGYIQERSKALEQKEKWHNIAMRFDGAIALLDELINSSNIDVEVPEASKLSAVKSKTGG